MNTKQKIWTKEDDALLLKLIEQGVSRCVIATTLGRSVNSLKSRQYLLKGVSSDAPIRGSVPQDVQDTRVAYINAPHQSITGEFFGDPKRGFSALDQRGA